MLLERWQSHARSRAAVIREKYVDHGGAQDAAEHCRQSAGASIFGSIATNSKQSTAVSIARLQDHEMKIWEPRNVSEEIAPDSASFHTTPHVRLIQLERGIFLSHTLRSASLPRLQSLPRAKRGYQASRRACSTPSLSSRWSKLKSRFDSRRTGHTHSNRGLPGADILQNS